MNLILMQAAIVPDASEGITEVGVTLSSSSIKVGLVFYNELDIAAGPMDDGYHKS
jgi:hypothetical protein